MSLSLLDTMILRVLVASGYVTKGSSITWPEEDQNFIIIGDALRELNDATDGGFEPYNPATTYNSSPPSFVSYNGNIWEYISPVPQSGITPGTDATVWQLSSVGAFAHLQNTDFYLDFGGPDQVDADEIRTLLDSPLVYGTGGTSDYIRGDGSIAPFPSIPDSGEFWALGGNDLNTLSPVAEQNFGTKSNHGIPFITNNLARGKIISSGELVWGDNTAFADTLFTVKGTTSDSSKYAQTWIDAMDTVVAWARNDGIFNATNGFAIEGDIVFRVNNSLNNIIVGTTNYDEDNGTDSIVFGFDAGYSASDINRSVIIGTGAAIDAVSITDSMILGYRAGFNCDTVSRVMYIGPESGYYNETGDDQVFIGRNCGPVSGATNLDAVMGFGSGAVVRASNEASFGSNDSPINRYYFGRGQSETTTFEDIIITAHGYPNNAIDQNSGGSIGFGAPPARGTGTSGDIEFWYCPPVASGTTLQTWTLAARIDGPSGDAIFTNDIEIGSGAAFYIGDQNTNGSWRMRYSGSDFLIDRREAGVWVNKFTQSA